MLNNSPTSSKPNTSSDTASLSKKRKRSSVQDTSLVVATTPTAVALPPPFVPFTPHFYYPAVYHHHHHQQQQQHPYFIPIGPQPPISPSLTPTPTSPIKSTNAAPQRILPKSPTFNPVTQHIISPTALAPSYNLYPYHPGIQLHPDTVNATNLSTTTTTTATATATTNAAAMIPSPSFQPTLHRNSSSSIITTPTTADQRELARKESHSAIERRRREKMNDKIIQLKELIPSCSNNKETLHKMNILQNAIDYIIHLQETIKKLERNTTLNEDTCLLTCRNNKMKAQEDHNSTIKENTQTNHTKNQQCVINQSIPIEEDKRQEEEEDEEEDDDTWSASSLSSLKSNSLVMTPQKGLKPMDVIQNNNSPILPPKIVIAKGSQENSPNLQSKLPSVNMNIENILC